MSLSVTERMGKGGRETVGPGEQDEAFSGLPRRRDLHSKDELASGLN